MIKIFIIESIVFIEDMDIFSYDNFFSQYSFLLQEPLPHGWLNIRKVFYTNDMTLFPQTSIWRYNNYLYRFRLVAKRGFFLYYSYFLVPKVWFRSSFFSRGLPYHFIFVQFYNLNYLVGNSYVNFERYFDIFENINIRHLDINLLYDSVYGLFSAEDYYIGNAYLAGTGIVFYRLDVYRYEWLLMGLRVFKPYLKYSILNPNSVYLSQGIFYARKWLIYAYMTYNAEPLLPRGLYMYNLSIFFDTQPFYKIVLIDNIIFNWFKNYIVGNMIFIYSYFYINLCIFFCYIYIYFYNKKKMFAYVYLLTPLYFFSPLIDRIFVISSYLRKFIRLRNYYYLKTKANRGFARKSETENYYFNLIRKYFFRTLLKLFNRYILNHKKYITNINNNLLNNKNNLKLIYHVYFFLLILFFFFLKVLLYFKRFIYYIYYFYCLKINKYVNFKHTLFLFVWFIPNIVILRDVDSLDAYEALNRYANFKRYYKKKEYKKFVKEDVWRLYEMRMWQKSQIDEAVKEQYVSYFYHRYFFDYEPWFELLWVIGPRILFKLHLNFDDLFSKKIQIYHLTTVFNFYSSKFYFISKFRNYRILYTLNYFFYLNFWKLYYFYVYKLALNKSNSYFKFAQLWFLYLYKLFIQLYSGITYMLKFIFTPQRMLFSYYFYKSLPVIINYLNTFILFFYLYKIYLSMHNIVYLFIFYLIDIIHIHVYKFFLFIFNRLNGLGFFLSRADHGFSYNFWYKYYIFKFYLIEYNIIYNFFIYLRDFMFNLIVIFSVFYLFFSMPYISYLSTDNVLFFFENFVNFLHNLSITGYIDYTLNIDNIYFLNDVKFQDLFNNFVIFFTNNFANYYWDLQNTFVERMTGHTIHSIWMVRHGYAEELFDMIDYLIYLRYNYLGIDLEGLHQKYTPNFARWWIYFYLHLYLSSHGDARKFMMWSLYWYAFYPVYFYWWYYIKYHIIYMYFILPAFWVWQYLGAYITYYFLYIFSFIPPLYYIIFFFLKFMYLIYSYIYLSILYLAYYYYYYFWAIYPKIHIFLMNSSQFSEMFKYDCLKFYISLDILNIIKLILNSISIFFYHLFSGIFFYFYKILSWIFMFFGFTYFENADYFAFNYLDQFRSFVGEFFTKLLPIHYDLNEYNGIFDERIHNRTGKKRKVIRVKVLRMVWYSFMKHLKFRTVTFEYRLRGFLFQDINVLNSMLLYERLFEFRNWNLFYFMLFSLYFNFFLVLFFTGVIFIKGIEIFKDTRHISHSGTYEWKNSFIKKNKINLGLDDFYWLYNVRWLKAFEFYLDKHFNDDFYVYEFERSKMRAGAYLYYALNDLFLTENKSFSKFYEDNRYYKFRRYYFDRYTIFIKDIDFLFHIFSISKRNLKMRSKIFNFFKFDFLFKKKKKDDINYMYDNEMLRTLDRMDYVWLLCITPNLLYGRDWHDMKIFSQNIVSKELYAKIKKCLFKAYAIYEMNQKEFPFDLFEFQFFDKDFYNLILENYGHGFKNDEIDNPVLSKITYSRFHNVFLYTSFDGSSLKKIHNLIGYEEFLNKIESYFIYLKKINKNYFNNFIDFSLFSFMESISFTLTHINPDLAKTAVDIDRGRLIGVSYRKSMLLDEFTSTEITENVFNAVDTYLKKSNFNNIDVFSMLLREDRVTVVRDISPLWIVFIMIPFFFLYVEFDTMFKYGRFILPNLALVEAFHFITDQIFGIYFADNYAWHGLWIHDHRSYSKRLRYQFKTGHLRAIVWDLRWADLQGFWVGKNAYLFKAKLDYAYLMVYWFNDFYPRKFIFNRFWDYYFKDIFKYFYIRIMFYLIDLIAFILCVIFIYFFATVYFNSYKFYTYYINKDLESELDVEYRLTGDAEKTFKSMQEKEKKRRQYRNRNVLEDIAKEIDKHKKLVEFIEEHKKQEKKKEENKKNL